MKLHWDCIQLSLFSWLIFRILYIPSTGRNWREMAPSAWNMLIMSFPSSFNKALSKMTSWTWWSSLVWSPNTQPPQLKKSTLCQLNSSHHLKSFVKWNHRTLILVLCIFTLCMALSLMVCSHSLCHDPFVGVVRLGPRGNPSCTKMEHGLLSGNKSMISFWFARWVLSRSSLGKEHKANRFQVRPQKN